MDPTQWTKTSALEQVENAFALGRGNAHTALPADIRPKKNGNKPQKWPTGFSQHLAVLSTVFASTEVMCTTLRETIAARQAGSTRGKGSAPYVTIADMRAPMEWYKEQVAIPTVVGHGEARETPTYPGHARDDSLDGHGHGDGPDEPVRYSPVLPSFQPSRRGFGTFSSRAEQLRTLRAGHSGVGTSKRRREDSEDEEVHLENVENIRSNRKRARIQKSTNSRSSNPMGDETILNHLHYLPSLEDSNGRPRYLDDDDDDTLARRRALSISGPAQALSHVTFDERYPIPIGASIDEKLQMLQLLKKRSEGKTSEIEYRILGARIEKRNAGRPANGLFGE